MFSAGFAPRHAAEPERIARALRAVPTGFAAAAPGAASTVVRAFRSEPAGPRHFSPAEPGHDATGGWNPLDAASEPAPALAAEAARDAAYAEGLAEGLLRGRARDDALLADVACGLSSRVDRERLAEGLRATVLALVTRLVGEAGVSGDLLTERVRAATELLAGEAESAILRVHPDDVALLIGRVPDSVFPVGDASVERGAFVLESQSSVVEDGPALWLRQLGEHLDRLGMPL